MLKSLRSDIHDGCHGGHLEIVQTISPPEPWIEIKLDGRHQGDMKIQNCLKRFVPIVKITAIPAIQKIFNPHLLPNVKSDCTLTWWETLGRHGDSELLKSFCSDIQYGRLGCGHLENLQTVSTPERCRNKPKFGGWY